MSLALLATSGIAEVLTLVIVTVVVFGSGLGISGTGITGTGTGTGTDIFCTSLSAGNTTASSLLTSCVGAGSTRILKFC